MRDLDYLAPVTALIAHFALISIVGMAMTPDSTSCANALDYKIVMRGGAENADAAEFMTQVREFLDGVVNYDGLPFFKHLRRDLFAISILSGNTVIDGYDRYLEFQRGWNEKKDAKWSYKIEHVFLYNKNAGSVIIVATYEDVDSQGIRFRKIIRIKDSFIRDGGTWFMTENQNTLISEEKPFH